jgi:hypothetical protein
MLYRDKVRCLASILCREKLCLQSDSLIYVKNSASGGGPIYGSVISSDPLSCKHLFRIHQALFGST